MGMVIGLLMIVITLTAMFGTAYVTGTTSNGVAIVRRPNLRSSVTRSSLGASLSNCNCEVLGMRDAKNGQSSWVMYRKVRQWHNTALLFKLLAVTELPNATRIK